MPAILKYINFSLLLHCALNKVTCYQRLKIYVLINIIMIRILESNRNCVLNRIVYRSI